MREPQTKEIGGRQYSVTPAPARRALAALPLIGDDTKYTQLAELLLKDLSRVDNADLWPMVDTHFAGDLESFLGLLSFAVEVSTGFKRAADGTAKAESHSGT
jgi:hypothetical protein